LEALSSVQELEKIIEAANALLSTEKTLEEPKKAVEAAEVARPDEQGSAIMQEIGRNDSGSDPVVRPNAGHNLNLRSKVPFFFFLTSLAIWLVSLLAVYLPVSGGVTHNPPLSTDGSILMIFFVSTGLASISSLLIGLHKLGR
jgi:hypothetical protein